jgi:membrane-bound metal-dependent hydrolase YbcI (DUF457 family)
MSASPCRQCLPASLRKQDAGTIGDHGERVLHRSLDARLDGTDGGLDVKMTVYEHAMIGIDGALALGLNQRWGWPIVAMAGAAAVLPDLDGLTLLFGLHWYAEGHRLWGHNLLVVGIAAVVVSAAAYCTDVFPRIQCWLARHCADLGVGDESADVPRPRRIVDLGVWVAVGVVAAYIHLLADVIYSAGADLPIWGVPLYWPFSREAVVYPLLPWGDVGPTLVFAAGMFAMLRWPKRIQTIAAASLALVVAYVASRGFLLS